MTKHRSTGEPDEQSEAPILGAGDVIKPGDVIGADHPTTGPTRPRRQPREERPDESDEVLVILLPPSREGPGELIKVPAQNFGFAITVNHVLYVHVSDAEDGTYQYIPFSAKS